MTFIPTKAQARRWREVVAHQAAVEERYAKRKERKPPMTTQEEMADLRRADEARVWARLMKRTDELYNRVEALERQIDVLRQDALRMHLDNDERIRALENKEV